MRSTSTESPRRWSGASWATAFGGRVDLVRVADGRGERARLAIRRRAEKDQAPWIAPVDAALGHDPVHRDIPALGVDRLQLPQLIAESDDEIGRASGRER